MPSRTSGSARTASRFALFVWLVAMAAASVAARPAVVAGASCPALPVSVSELVALQRPPGPLAKRFALGVTAINERALACFGSRELSLTAFVNEPDGIGGTTSFAITPSWIVGGSLIVFGSAREVSPGYGDGPFFFVSARPSLGDLQRRYARRWVTIRGHFDDRAAAGCRATGPAGVTPTKAQAVAICRTMFVLTSIRTAQAPDTSMATPPATQTGQPWSGLWPGMLAGTLVALRVLRRPRAPQT
jgi:hypothetical protein